MKISYESVREYYMLHRNKINMIISATIVLIVFIVLFYYYSKNRTIRNNDIVSVVEISTLEKEEISTIEKGEEVSTLNIYVDIKGSVVNEGVYNIEYGSRVIDLIKKAGGLKKDANTRFINLSKILNDGEVIVIYSNNEIEEAKKSNLIYIETPCVCEEVKNDACIEENVKVENDLININTADVEELSTLSGIGEAKANAIIEYRNTNGSFTNIEDILNVSGISETLYSKIKDYITI